MISLALAVVVSAMTLLPVACSAADSAGADRPTSWKFKNQEEWMVDAIGRDIAEMLFYAAAIGAQKDFSAERINFSTKQLDGQAQKYSIAVESESLAEPVIYDLTLQKCILETANYKPLAQQLMQRLKLTATPSRAPVDSTELLKKLADGTSESLYAQNKLVSDQLSKAPLDPALHEQAALVHSVFMLQDMSGYFYDPRFGHARVAAHLALAEALRGGEATSLCGKFAATALTGQSSRDTETVERAAALESQASNSVEKSWVRMLKLVGTNDPRVFSKTDFTPIEEFQYAKRLAFFEDGDAVVKYIQSKGYRPSVKWSRLVCNGDVSVGTGHMFKSPALQLEMSDFLRDYQIWQQPEFKDFSTIAAKLNLLPTRCLVMQNNQARLEAISWPDMANWHERQILLGFIRSHRFQTDQFGDKEGAAQLLIRGAKILVDTRHYPFAFNDMDVEGVDMTPLIKRASAVIAEYPEIVNSVCWFGMSEAQEKAKDKNLIPAPVLWFGDLPLYGTAFDFPFYLDELKSTKLDLKTMDQLKEIAIYNRYVCEAWIKAKYGDNATGEQTEEGYGKMLEFDSTARSAVAYADYGKPAKYIERMAKICETEPNTYFHLAQYCWSRGMPELTLKYYELGMQKAEDDILIANSCRWWVNYLYDHGRKPEAMKVAQDAAQVYSHGGLETLAKLYERNKNLKGAEEYYKKIVERYDHPFDLNAFYVRHSKTNPQYAALAKPFLQKNIPGGALLPDQVAQRKSPPQSGLLITESAWDGKLFGFKNGEIITGLNGYRTRTIDEYNFVKELTHLNDRLRLTVWTGHGYKEVDAPSISGMLGVTFKNYPDAEKPSAR